MTMSTTNRRWLRIAAPGFLLTMALFAPAWAQDAAAPVDPDAGADQAVTLETSSAITPEAQAVLDRMKETFDSMQRYSISAQITRDEVLPFGYKLQNNEAARMWVELPNKMRVEVEGDIKDRTYVYDGSQLTMFAPDLNVYAVSPAPNNLRELIGELLGAGVEMPLIDMLYQGATGSLTDAVRVGLVVGDSEVEGVPADHLAFRQADLDWQLWVGKGKNALPLKMLITTRYEVGDPQYQAILHWELSPRMAANAFKFVPPADAVKIPSRTNLAAAGGDE